MPRLVADLLRCLALFAVIVIHAADAWAAVPGHPAGVADWLLVLTDQLGRFCVPLFVLLSGHALGRRYAGDDFATGSFYGRRATRIGVPYVFWALLSTAGYIALEHWRWGNDWATAVAKPVDAVGLPWSEWLLSLRPLREFVFAEYHLYFLAIVLQCYLLFPLLRRWRAGAAGVTAMVALQMGALGWQEAARMTGVWIPPLWSVALPWWLGYFQCGVWLAQHEERVAAWIRRWPAALALAVVASGPVAVVADLAWATARGVPSGAAGAFDRPAIAWYLATVLAAALRWGPQVEALLVRRGRLAATITAIAAASFATYLAHTWVLRLTGMAIGEPADPALRALPRLLWIPLCIALSLAVGHALQALGRRVKAVGWTIGA